MCMLNAYETTKAYFFLTPRYHIHECNKDDLILCILPYHDSKVFVRALQILDINNPADKWHWLLPSAVRMSSLKLEI